MHLELLPSSSLIFEVNLIFVLLMQKIAEVREASIQDYEEGMQACNEAAKVWMQVR